MSRVEKIDESQKSVSRMKDEVLEKFGDDKKKKQRQFSCFFVLLAGLILVACFIAWSIASTGLLTIPVFSSVAFVSPKPIRDVVAGTPVEQLSESYFKTTLTQRLQSGGGVLTDRSVTLVLPESSLTATLQNSLTQSAVTGIDVAHAQIAVLPGQELELFLPVHTKDGFTALNVHIALIADKGQFDLTLKEVKIGSLQVPSALVASLIQPFVNRELATLNQALSSYMQVDSLTTQSGLLSASGVFTVQIKK